MASVQLRNVTKAWGDVVVSKDINLDIHEGEFVVLLAKIVAILCAHLHITANSVTEITQSNGGA